MKKSLQELELVTPTINLLETRTIVGGELPEVVVVAPYPDNDTGYDFRGDNDPYENDERDYEDRYDDQGHDDREGTDNGTQEKGNGEYNVDDATKYLREHAYEKSQSKCAKAVRLALEAGGLDTSGRPAAAADYNDGFLQSLGFIEVSPENYTPQAGDIVVHERQDGHPYGHIAMYDGTEWISDFVQIDMFGGSAYRNNPDYSLWRK